MTNRLHLDFHLNTNKERAAFVEEYLKRDEFISRPPTESEMETIANYILWGKSEQTGNNFVQDKLGDIETRNKTWTTDTTESLDALMESPTFNEATLAQTITKKTHETFSRSQARQQCPSYLLPQLESLFHQIDVIDLGINYYDLAHGKRSKDIREQLISRFDEEERISIQEQVNHWNQYYYLKQKHLLVELRREQFTLRDSFVTVVQRNTLPTMVMPNYAEFGSDIAVLPLGIGKELIFRNSSELNPFSYSEEELREISRYYWEYVDLQKKLDKDKANYFDFRDREHVYQLFLNYFDVEDDLKKIDDRINESNKLLDTLKYYVELADFDDMHRYIIEAKMKHVSNVDIAIYLKKNYQKNYSANYISTIFRQRIIPKINIAAERHFEIIGKLFFEEEFKKCTCCGKWLLRDAESFVRKSRSPDGLSTRCKKCDKEIRNSKNKE